MRSFDDELGAPQPEPCDHCGEPCVPGAVDAELGEYSLVVSARVRGALNRYWRFCSAKCRAEWWASPDENPFKEVHGPRNLPDCIHCGGEAFGMYLCATDGHDHDGECPHCDEAGKEAPAFYCSHDEADAELAPNFDRDFEVMIVLGQVGSTQKKSARAAFACPCVFNAWWQKEAADHERLPEPPAAASSPILDASVPRKIVAPAAVDVDDEEVAEETPS